MARKKEKKEEDKLDLLRKKSKGADDDMDYDEEEGEGIGSRLVVFFVTLFIIAIWLGIIGLVIKWDVGGFGSSVLTPILKDVPVLNKILPENPETDLLVETTETEFSPYDSLEDAIEQIKELELQLDSANKQIEDDGETITELQSQISALSVYKEQQAKFEAEKEKFYEEVVFSDQAPDINEYKTYYESIDPENAEVLYKQVVEQLQYESEVEEYVKTYSSMKPKNAAAIFDTMTDNFGLVADILANMESQARSDILAAMTAENAARLTEILEPER